MFSDEVVCIDASGFPELKLGKIYPLLGYSKFGNCKCKYPVVNVGLDSISAEGLRINVGDLIRCIGCNTKYVYDGIYWCRASRFAPIDSVDISELTERLTEEPFKV